MFRCIHSDIVWSDLGTFSQEFASKIFVGKAGIMIARFAEFEEIVFEVELSFDRIKLVCKNFNLIAVFVVLVCLVFGC